VRARKTGTGIRQEQIVEAALDIIGDQGVSALGISGIAARVGIVPSAIYRHFESKDAVLDAILEYMENRVLGNVFRAREEAKESTERLRMLLMNHVQMLDKIRAVPYILFSDGMFAGHPERKERIVKIMTSYLDQIQRIIREGKKDGSIRKDLDPLTASVMFLGMIVPGAIFQNLSSDGFDLVSHVGKAWPAFLEHISARNRKSAHG